MNEPSENSVRPVTRIRRVTAGRVKTTSESPTTSENDSEENHPTMRIDTPAADRIIKRSIAPSNQTSRTVSFVNGAPCLPDSRNCVRGSIPCLFLSVMEKLTRRLVECGAHGTGVISQMCDRMKKLGEEWYELRKLLFQRSKAIEEEISQHSNKGGYRSKVNDMLSEGKVHPENIEVSEAYGPEDLQVARKNVVMIMCNLAISYLMVDDTQTLQQEICRFALNTTSTAELRAAQEKGEEKPVVYPKFIEKWRSFCSIEVSQRKGYPQILAYLLDELVAVRRFQQQNLEEKIICRDAFDRLRIKRDKTVDVIKDKKTDIGTQLKMKEELDKIVVEMSTETETLANLARENNESRNKAEFLLTVINYRLQADCFTDLGSLVQDLDSDRRGATWTNDDRSWETRNPSFVGTNYFLLPNYCPSIDAGIYRFGGDRDP